MVALPKRKITEMEPEMVRMYESGYSTNKIAQHLGVGHETVRRRLKQNGFNPPSGKQVYDRDQKLRDGMKMRKHVERLRSRIKAGDMVAIAVDEPDPKDRTVTRPVRRKYRVDHVLPNGVVVSGNGKRRMMVTFVELVEQRNQENAYLAEESE